MARIPRVAPGGTQLSNPKLTTESPNAFQTQSTGTGQGIAALGQSVEKSANYLYQKMDEARDYTETAKGSLFVSEENNKLAVEMTQGTVIGPDGNPRRRTGTPEDIAYYKNKQKQILETAKGFHTSKDGEMRAGFNYQKDALVTENAIQNSWLKTTISDGQAATEGWLDKLANHYSMSGSPRALEEMEKVLENATLKGFYNSNDARKLLEKTQDTAKFNRFLHNYQINPTDAAKNIKSFDLSIEQRQKAERISQETEKIVNENRAVNFSKATESALNNMLIDSDVDALVAADKANPGSGIKEKDGRKIREAIMAGLIKKVTGLSATNEEAKNFTENATKLFALDDENRIDAYRTIVDMYSDGFADEKELKFLNQLVASNATIDKIKKEKLTNWFIFKNEDATDKRKKERMAIELKSVLSMMADGKEFEAATKEVNKQSILTDYPEIVKYPKGRVGIDNATGIKYRWNDDGTKDEIK